MKLKKILNKAMYFTAALFIALSLLSCQDEESEITNPEPSEVLGNDSILTNLISSAVSEEDSQEHIKCLDFEYPISISVFDTSFDVADTENINTDAQFFSFLETLDGIIASINYPITTLFASEELIEINDNEGLTSILLDAQGTTCNEIEEDPEIIAANEIIIGCTWVMDRYIVDGERTIFPADFFTTFEFAEDGTFIYSDSTTFYDGDWNFEKDDNNNLLLILNPSQSLPENIDYDYKIDTLRDGFMLWSAINANQEIIIGFEKDCTIETEEDPEITAAKEIIVNDGCTWAMDRYIVDGQRPFDSTVGRTFEFFEDGTFIFSDSTTYIGDWTFEIDTNGDLILILEPEQSLPEYIDYDFTMSELREGFMLWLAVNTNQEIITGFEQSCN